MQTTIIIPCYNEADRLVPKLFIDFLKKHPSLMFLFVNDGSSDSTLELLRAMAAECERVRYLNLYPNTGKAEAVRLGMLLTIHKLESDYIGFWDADLATPLSEIDRFISIIKKGDCQMVTGLRLLRLGANIRRKPMRHYLGRIFATRASILLNLPVYDTQCGAKLYARSVVPALFKQPFVTKWLFDVELLARYVQYFGRESALANIHELPLLEWVDVGGSRLKMSDFIKAPLELWRIKRAYKL